MGPVTALAYVLTLEQSSHFRSNRSAAAFVGLCPKRDQSGGRDPQLRITKAGDKYLRRLLINCAHHIMGPFGKPSQLRRFGERIAGTGSKNGKKRAVVAVARKLSILLLILWKTGQQYDPFYHSSKVAA